MKLNRITSVRHLQKEGRRLIERFLFKGMYGGPRVPRGVEPAMAAQVIQQEVKPDSSPDAYLRSLEVARFYELSELVPQMLSLLTGPVTDAVALLRKAYATQFVAELGSPDEVAKAAEYLDTVIVPSPPAPRAFPALFQAMESLAPAGTPQKLFDRLQREQAALGTTQRQSEADMMAYDKLAAIAHNDWPKAKLGCDAKAKLAAQPPEARREALVKMYLGKMAGSDETTTVWAARMLRLEAMSVDADPVKAEFAKVVDAIPLDKVADQNVGFVVARAGQAIVYLLGALTKPQKDRLAAAKGAANFLWDDPN